MIRVLALALSVFMSPWGSSTWASGNSIRVSTEAVSRPDLDISAMPKGKVLAVVNWRTRTSFILPHFDGKWELVLEDSGRITGESASYRVTSTVSDLQAADQRAYLESLLEKVKSAATIQVHDAALIEYGDNLVLRYRSQPKKLPRKLRSLDPWFWHYWTAQRVEGGWVDLHLSTVEPSEELPERDEVITIALAQGLRALAGDE